MPEPGDVIWLSADTLGLPKSKMHVCVCVEDGWYFRINTKGHFAASFLISAAENPFLKHDSHIECGAILEVDEYETRETKIAGTLSSATIASLMVHIRGTPALTVDERNRILAAFGHKPV
ncbi:MAG: hypothetical protein ACYYKD_09810 [Rhodospirillales bacterium]